MNNLAPIPVNEFEKRPRFVVTNTNTIMATAFAPIQWVVPDYLPEGLSILAGRQKLGKTWLALDWAIAVATGGAAMGSIFCDVGDVLYIDAYEIAVSIENEPVAEAEKRDPLAALKGHAERGGQNAARQKSADRSPRREERAAAAPGLHAGGRHDERRLAPRCAAQPLRARRVAGAVRRGAAGGGGAAHGDGAGPRGDAAGRAVAGARVARHAA